MKEEEGNHGTTNSQTQRLEVFQKERLENDSICCSSCQQSYYEDVNVSKSLLFRRRLCC